MAEMIFPNSFIRQFNGPLDVDLVFSTTANRINYLTNARRYPGQIVSDLQDGKSYKLNSSGTNWEEFGSINTYQGTDIKNLSANWESTYTTFRDVSSTFLTSETDAQTLSFNEGTKDLSISNGNTVSLSALIDGTSVDTGIRALTANWQSTYTIVQGNSAQWASNVDTGVRSLTGNWQSTYLNQSNYLPLSGGTVTGVTQFNSNVTVYGNISATGNSYFANTVYSTTSALSVINLGNTGPAVYVGNNGTGDIASFYDLDQNIEVLHIGGSNGTFPNVGIKTSEPNKDLTVKGELSASGIIYSENNNSTQWNNVYTQVQGNSAQWASNVDTGVRSLTGNWQSTYTTVQGNSAQWASNVDTGVRSLTSNWQSTYTTVQGNSAQWASNVDTGVRSLTGNWQDTSTVVQSKSAQWDAAYGSAGTDLAVRSLTANWQSTYTTVQGNSAQWASNVDTGVRALTANWQSTYTTVQGNSAQWASNVDTGVRALTSNWQSTYATVSFLSALWEESAEILPTVTNYLSSNNIKLSSVSVNETVNINNVQFTGEVNSTSSDITATNVFIKVVVNGNELYLRLYNLI
jgi:hypothetical protein